MKEKAKKDSCAENADCADCKKEQEQKETPKADESKGEIETLKKSCDDLKDNLLRTMAEFQNYRKRTENSISDMLKYAGEDIIVKVLDLYDDLQRSVENAGKTDNLDSVKEGLDLVLAKFNKMLQEVEVKKIDAIGKEFNVDYHEALLQQPKEGVPANQVIMEVQNGYTFKDKVIRHAKVIVSADSPEIPEAKEESK